MVDTKRYKDWLVMAEKDLKSEDKWQNWSVPKTIMTTRSAGGHNCFTHAKIE